MIYSIISIVLSLSSIALWWFGKPPGIKLSPLEKEMLRQCITNNIDTLTALNELFDPEEAADTLHNLDKLKEKIK